jgi:deazaflavin-dependent oxidoreductase (nitroreductase family)
MSNVAATTWEDQLVADLRANGGRPSAGPMAGEALAVLFTTGVRSGAERRAVLSVTRDGDDYVVAATNAGRPDAPSWLANLRANPRVRFEADGKSWTGTAIITTGHDRDRLWDGHVAVLPRFADYPARTGGRVIDMVRLRPEAGDRPPADEPA